MLRARGQITIPEHIRTALHLQVNDPLLVEVTDEGILLRPQRMIDAAQAWFWAPKWQEAEREVDTDLESGRSETYESAEAFLTALRARQKHADV
jgi:AbrB family looped-hinge helix DNA binding protein